MFSPVILWGNVQTSDPKYLKGLKAVSCPAFILICQWNKKSSYFGNPMSKRHLYNLFFLNVYIAAIDPSVVDHIS